MANEPFLLETDRLLLRRFTDADLDSFLSYRNDPDVARWQGWSVPYPRETAIERFDEMNKQDLDAPEAWLQIAIIVKNNREMIGDCVFFPNKNDQRQAYIGCTIAQNHWRKGYAVEALSRLLAYLFEERGVHRVIAETDVENVAAWTTLERLGFRRESHLIENIWFKGAWGSEYHYAMLEREWKLLA
jgi:RimJ/RimL family protein N-acetyltransferase